MILCACGCGESIRKYNYEGRERKYKYWHGRKGISTGKRSDETKAKISAAKKGKPLSEQNKINLKAARKRFFENGGVHPRLGRKLTADHNKKLHDPLRYKTGANHWNWKGGKSSPAEKIRKSAEYKAWRLKVYRRDKFSCVECGYRSHKNMDIIADHINPFYFFPELRLDVNNGRTLCIKCDKKIGFNYSRDRQKYESLKTK